MQLRALCPEKGVNFDSLCSHLHYVLDCGDAEGPDSASLPQDYVLR